MHFPELLSESVCLKVFIFVKNIHVSLDIRKIAEVALQLTTGTSLTNLFLHNLLQQAIALAAY